MGITYSWVSVVRFSIILTFAFNAPTKILNFITVMKGLAEFLPELISFRKELHQNPEISGKEQKTARLITNFCRQFHPDLVIEKLGNTGVAFVFDSKKPGNTLLFRADMDALPIEEEIEVPYTSQKKRVSHKCGHDGHMTIVAGLAFMLNLHPVRSGKVVLLYQPAEETGKGALAVLKDTRFKAIKPDFVFALHNLPGFRSNAIIVRDGPFAMASEGLAIHLKGHAAHAAYPEQGISPVPALLDLMKKFPRLVEDGELYKGFVQISMTYAKIGRFGFGTMPGNAEFGYTLRAAEDADLQRLRAQMTRQVAKAATQYYLEETYQRFEPFAATVNEVSSVNIIRKVANRHHLQVVELPEPFRWSEDFGQFTSRFKGAMFGLGAGENQSDLHTWYYDFPDELIETGIKMFYGIIQDLT
jgi:amidohydrolase